MSSLYKQILIFIFALSKLLGIAERKKIFSLLIIQSIAFILLLLFFKDVKEIDTEQLTTVIKPIVFFISFSIVNLYESRFRYNFGFKTSSIFHQFVYEKNIELYAKSIKLFKTSFFGNIMGTAVFFSNFLIIPFYFLVIIYIFSSIFLFLNFSIIAHTLTFIFFYLLLYYLKSRRIINHTKLYDESLKKDKFKIKNNLNDRINVQKLFFVNVRTNSELISIINLTFALVYGAVGYFFFKDEFTIFIQQISDFELIFYLFMLYKSMNEITRSLSVCLRFFKHFKIIVFLDK